MMMLLLLLLLLLLLFLFVFFAFAFALCSPNEFRKKSTGTWNIWFHYNVTESEILLNTLPSSFYLSNLNKCFYQAFLVNEK